jgi:hypothetical protein
LPDVGGGRLGWICWSRFDGEYSIRLSGVLGAFGSVGFYIPSIISPASVLSFCSGIGIGVYSQAAYDYLFSFLTVEVSFVARLESRQVIAPVFSYLFLVPTVLYLAGDIITRVLLLHLFIGRAAVWHEREKGHVGISTIYGASITKGDT